MPNDILVRPHRKRSVEIARVMSPQHKPFRDNPWCFESRCGRQAGPSPIFPLAGHILVSPVDLAKQKLTNGKVRQPLAQETISRDPERRNGDLTYGGA